LFNVNDKVSFTRSDGSGNFKVKRIAYDRRLETFLYSLDFRSIVTGANLRMYEEDLTARPVFDATQQDGHEAQAKSDEEAELGTPDYTSESTKGSELADLSIQRTTVETPHELELRKIRVTDSDNVAYFETSCPKPLSNVMDKFCKQYGRGRNTVRFVFDGTRINETDTPDTVSTKSARCWRHNKRSKYRTMLTEIML